MAENNIYVSIPGQMDRPSEAQVPLKILARLREGKLIRKLPLLLLITYLGCLLGTVQFVPDGPGERDSYYHARLSQQLPKLGLARSFPWTQVSTWKDRFCDKEFLYHLLLVPFTRDEQEPIVGAKVFTILLVLTITLALYYILRFHGARWPLFFVGLLFCMGGSFLTRLIMVRSHVLSIFLVIIGVHLLISRRTRALAILGFVFAWSYTFPLLLVMIAVPFTLGRWLGGGEFDWRPPLAATAGVFLGLAIHPYSPLTLETFLTYLNVVFIASTGADTSWIELGGEIYPMLTRSFLRYDPLLNLSVISLCLLGWRSSKRISPEALGCLCTALFWYLMTMVFHRFIEYSAPLMVFALALATRDVISNQTSSGSPGLNDPRRLSGQKWRQLSMATIVLIVIGFHVHSVVDYIGNVAPHPGPRFRGAAAWMTKHLAPGQTVLNLFWDEFPDLFYDGYRQRYIWALDPTYTIRYDKEKAFLLEKTRTGMIPLDGPRLARTFHTRYLIIRRDRVQAFKELDTLKYKCLYRDKTAMIFDLLTAGNT